MSDDTTKDTKTTPIDDAIAALRRMEESGTHRLDIITVMSVHLEKIKAMPATPVPEFHRKNGGSIRRIEFPDAVIDIEYEPSLDQHSLHWQRKGCGLGSARFETREDMIEMEALANRGPR